MNSGLVSLIVNNNKIHTLRSAFGGPGALSITPLTYRAELGAETFRCRSRIFGASLCGGRAG